MAIVVVWKTFLCRRVEERVRDERVGSWGDAIDATRSTRLLAQFHFASRDWCMEDRVLRVSSQIP